MYIRFVEITIFILLVFSVNYFVLNFYDIGTIGDRGDKGNKGLKINNLKILRNIF